MASTSMIRTVVKQGEPAVFLARIRGMSGLYITQASLSAIAYAIYDMRATVPLTPTSSGTVSIASCVYDVPVDPTLSAADRALWPNDDIGYNFRWTAPQTAFPNAGSGRKYRVEFKFTVTTGEKFSVNFLVEPVTTLSAPL